LEHPGGNVTGVTTWNPDQQRAGLALLREVVPDLARVGLVAPPGIVGYDLQLQELQAAGDAMGISVRQLVLETSDQFEAVLDEAVRDGMGALVVPGSTVLWRSNPRVFNDLAIARRLPTLNDDGLELVQSGGLLALESEYLPAFRRSIVLV